MTPTIASILEQHVTFELESIDRLYLNGYVPGLQTPEAVAYFLRRHRGATFASSVLLDTISRDFARRIERFVRDNNIEVHRDYGAYGAGVEPDLPFLICTHKHPAHLHG